MNFPKLFYLSYPYIYTYMCVCVCVGYIYIYVGMYGKSIQKHIIGDYIFVECVRMMVLMVFLMLVHWYIK